MLKENVWKAGIKKKETLKLVPSDHISRRFDFLSIRGTGNKGMRWVLRSEMLADMNNYSYESIKYV